MEIAREKKQQQKGRKNSSSVMTESSSIWLEKSQKSRERVSKQEALWPDLLEDY